MTITKTKNNDITISNAILPDIACTSCASVIERSFNKETGITVNINFATKKATFNYDNKLWNEQKITKIMHSLGYDVFVFDKDDNQVLNNEHLHNSDEHQTHIKNWHKRQNLPLRSLIEVIIGWILLLPLLLTMLPGTSPIVTFLNNPYWQLALAIPIQFYFGRKFYCGIYRELVQQKWPGMHTLIAIGTNVAFFFSCYLIIVNKTHHLFFEVSASIIMIVLVGDLISMTMQKKATAGLESLMLMRNNNVLKYDINNNSETFIKVEDIRLGDILIVRKGENIPTDGIVMSTRALVNEAIITGESQVINKVMRQEVIGGSVNVGENFRMQATKIGKDTVLANIISNVESVQAQKPQLQKIADKIAGYFTPTIILIACLVFIIRFWAFGNSFQQAMEIAIATLIIACPCSLGIATPLAVAVGINKAAKMGIIYNKASAFEKITKINTICFDKTGTLTTGKLMISAIFGQEKHFAKAIAMERYSTHPIASAFSSYAQTHGITNNLVVSNVQEEIGRGIKAKYEQEQLQIAALSYFEQAKLPFSPFLKSFSRANFINGEVIVALVINNVITNIFILTDELQPSSLATINKIKGQNINVVLISGDNETQTATMAHRLGINRYYANVKPQGKAQLVGDLQAQGQKVAFVGDGVNDIIALEQADLAVAIGSGSDIAKKIGDITIAGSDISLVYKAIVLTRKTKNNIWANFIWAFSYNIIIIPLAMTGLIVPAIAALAMACSEITVLTNGLIFKYRKYKF